MPKRRKPLHPVVEIPEQSYPPSKAELEEPIVVPAGTFEDAVKAVVRPVKVQRNPTEPTENSCALGMERRHAMVRSCTRFEQANSSSNLGDVTTTPSSRRVAC